jgi:phosphoglycolate phosphatase
MFSFINLRSNSKNMTSSTAFRLFLETDQELPFSGNPLENVIIFCDFDGPIVDVSDRYYDTYRHALLQTQTFYQSHGQALYITPLTKEQFWQFKKDRVSDIEIAMRSGLEEEEITFFLDFVRNIVNHPLLLKKDKLQSGVNWALALLHSQGAKLVLVTLRCHDQVEEILNNYGLKRLFSGIYGSEDCNVAYQNNSAVKTQLLKQAIKDFGKENAYMIGDTEADIIAAQDRGIPVIGLTCGIRSQGYLQQFKPDQIHPDLLSTAHFLSLKKK